MTPAALKLARLTLGLTQHQMGLMLGYTGEQARGQIANMEAGRRTIRPAQQRLVDLYLSGVRTPDWPT